jgi:hypothetical protein
MAKKAKKIKKEKKVKVPKEKKPAKEKKVVNGKEAPVDITYGLEQAFVSSDGDDVLLRDFLKEGEWWVLKKKTSVSVILTHDAVKRIADRAGIRQDIRYEVLTQPTYQNNYQYLIQCTICDASGKCTTELGESNRANLGSRGRNNPANMAQKRAYDRAVFRHLGIIGLLGEDDIEEEKESNMKTLTPEEAKAIAPLINELLTVKKKSDVDTFNKKMKADKGKYTEDQLAVLRKLRDTKLGELTESF